MATAEELSIIGIVCDICLNEYKTYDKIRTIPCLHRFHTRCIDKWLKVRNIFVFVINLRSFFAYRKVRNVQCVEVIYANRNGIHPR